VAAITVYSAPEDGCKARAKQVEHISLFHRAFFNSIMDKTPTYALFTQHYISLAC